jgi:hypothetical protein
MRALVADASKNRLRQQGCNRPGAEDSEADA